MSQTLLFDSHKVDVVSKEMLIKKQTAVVQQLLQLLKNRTLTACVLNQSSWVGSRDFELKGLGRCIFADNRSTELNFIGVSACKCGRGFKMELCRTLTSMCQW